MYQHLIAKVKAELVRILECEDTPTIEWAVEVRKCTNILFTYTLMSDGIYMPRWFIIDEKDPDGQPQPLEVMLDRYSITHNAIQLAFQI